MTRTDFFLITVDSDATTYHDCMALCRAAIETPAESEVWTKAEKIRFGAADALKEYFETRLDDPGKGHPESTACLLATAVAAYLEEMNWQAMADHYLAKIKGGAS
jgi:hypothetical protein